MDILRLNPNVYEDLIIIRRIFKTENYSEKDDKFLLHDENVTYHLCALYVEGDIDDFYKYIDKKTFCIKSTFVLHPIIKIYKIEKWVK